MIYNSYKIFVLCSLYEGHPKTLLEALSCGCNCIGTNVPGIKELYSENNFYLVESNINDLSTTIKALMNKKKLGKNMNAVKYILKNYSIEIIASKFMNLYLKLNSQ